MFTVEHVIARLNTPATLSVATATKAKCIDILSGEIIPHCVCHEDAGYELALRAITLLWAASVSSGQTHLLAIARLPLTQQRDPIDPRSRVGMKADDSSPFRALDGERAAAWTANDLRDRRLRRGNECDQENRERTGGDDRCESYIHGISP
jgi:hypothetical protein